MIIIISGIRCAKEDLASSRLTRDVPKPGKRMSRMQYNVGKKALP